MLHTALIAGHAVSGVIAFGLGIFLAVRRARAGGGGHQPQAWLYAIALSLMTLLVTAAVAAGWGTQAAAARGIFVALLVLAAYTTWRGWRARSRLAAGQEAFSGALEDIGFTLITLFTAFVVILAGDLGGPVWLVVVLGVLAVLAGRRLVGLMISRRLPANPPAQRRGQKAAA